MLAWWSHSWSYDQQVTCSIDGLFAFI